MHRNVVLVTLVVAACGSREEPASVTVASRVPIATSATHKPDPIAKGVPHGSAIVLIAATDEGDAALTADTINGIRLWPTLDGNRTPVPVASSSQPSELALLHDGRDLVAVVLDAAGSVTITRLGLDGSLRGRAQLPGGTSYAEVVAVGGQILARTTDHAIELYQPDGTLRGRLTPEHGQRVTDIAARRDRAAAVIMTNDAYQLSWLRVGATLRWDTSMRLPLNPRDGMLAIAPGRRRIAFVDVGTTGLHVYDADLMPVAVVGANVSLNEAHNSLGFIDDNTVGASGSSLVWWTSSTVVTTPPDPDPWAVQARPPPPTQSATDGAFVDGHLVAPDNLALALIDRKRTRFLGWKEAAVHTVAPAGNHVAIASTGSQFTWLDGNLAMTRKLNLEEHRGERPAVYGTAIGEHHVLGQTSGGGKTKIILVDAAKPTEPVDVGTFDYVDRYEYIDGMVAVTTARKVHRYRVDLTTSSVVELKPPIPLGTASPSWVRLFDPEQSGGIIAAMQTWDTEYTERQSLLVFRQVGKRIKKSKMKPFDHQLLRSDATGRLFMLDGVNRASIVVMRGKQVESRTPLPGPVIYPLVINKLGTQIATKDEQNIVMLDAAGKEQWRKPLWAASTYTFVDDGKRLVVGAPGGLVAFDAATGEERAKECAWNFGLHDTAPVAQGMGFATVCEDPIVQ